MKREDLKSIGLENEAIDKIMAENGKDIESHKSKIAALETELKNTRDQLTEASATIESFKAMNIDQIKASADEWKTKAETAQAEAEKQINDLKFEHALESALSGAKAKNAKAVKALLNTNDLKIAEDGSIIGLKDQLEKIKSENEYMFESEKATPTIVFGAQNSQITPDAFTSALRKGAGLPEGK